MRILHPTPALELDRCPYGDGIWFDPGEISELARSFTGEHDVHRLSEVFARLETIMGEAQR